MRLQRNITQEEMAKAIGITRKTYGNLEQGQCKLENFIAALRVLGEIDQLNLLVPPASHSPLELLRREGSVRKRARHNKGENPEADIGW